MKRALFVWALTLAACSRPERVEPAAELGQETDSSARPAPFAERREERARLVARVGAQNELSEPVLRALREVPRHAFVAPSWAAEAYQDRPLPIGHGQTISQPSVVAAMTSAARPNPSDRCLEIGTGSGYQAAVLAELCAQVYSIEYLEPLAVAAERTLRALGYDSRRLALRHGDGYVGWPEAAPFDVVLVTAAPERAPQPLLDQLAVGGRLVIPVGRQHELQQLLLYRRTRSGAGEASFEREQLMGVRFVPFLGEGQQSTPARSLPRRP
jgi:protein-L-isoaspartate(D-aspartate) O-methyltransferase